MTVSRVLYSAFVMNKLECQEAFKALKHAVMSFRYGRLSIGKEQIVPCNVTCQVGTGGTLKTISVFPAALGRSQAPQCAWRYARAIAVSMHVAK